MKILLASVVTLFVLTNGISQPELTIWITPDGYHSDHSHHGSQQYFCDSSYYIFYHPNPDTIFITAKNEGTEPLELMAVNTFEIDGANFEVIGFSNQILLPDEMYTIKLLYQLPVEYVNGINGNLSITSNDPGKPDCILYFDIGCLAEWGLRTSPLMGVYGNCDEPVVYVREHQKLLNPNMLFNDSLTFYAFDGVDTSYKIMQLKDYGVVLRKDIIAYDRFFAGSTGNGSENALFVDSFGVNVNRYLDVSAKLHVADILDADNGIACSGALNVTGNTNLDGTLGVTGNAAVSGTLEVDVMTSPSDRRLKKDINPIRESLQKVMMLSPKTYYLKEDQTSTHRQFGFLAQELESIIPEVVHTNEEGMKSVNYLQIIPWLTAALQEQKRTIEQLEKRLTELESK